MTSSQHMAVEDFSAPYRTKFLIASRKLNPLLHNESKGKFVVKPKNPTVHTWGKNQSTRNLEQMKVSDQIHAPAAMSLAPIG
jgi:hypothetical protein